MSMKPEPRKPQTSAKDNYSIPLTTQSIDWYAEGESRIIVSDGVRVTVRFIGRKGRRGRIMISAPPGATFWSSEIGSVR